MDDRVTCILELEDELDSLAELCDGAAVHLQTLSEERGELARKLKKHGRHWAPEKRVAAEAQSRWLAEQCAAATDKATELAEQRLVVEQELERHLGKLTDRQREQLSRARASRANSRTF